MLKDTSSGAGYRSLSRWVRDVLFNAADRPSPRALDAAIAKAAGFTDRLAVLERMHVVPQEVQDEIREVREGFSTLLLALRSEPHK